MHDSHTAKWRFPLSFLLCWLWCTLVFAQTDDRRAAAEAYNRGTTAFLDENFEEAARAYEAAYDYAPTAEAMVQAARSHLKAGNTPRAATLALLLQEVYADHRIAPVVAKEILDKYRDDLLLVHVECGDCALQVDAGVQPQRSFFVTPDMDHELVASFASGEETHTINGVAGGEMQVTLAPQDEAAPTPPPVAATPPARAAPEAVEPEPQDDADGAPFGPAVVYVTAGLSAGLIGVAIWSTTDTLGGVDSYEAAADAFQQCEQGCEPLEQEARDLLDEGRDRQTRTTILWAAAGAMVVGTTLTALLLTDWDGESSDQTEGGVRFGIAPTGGGWDAHVGWTARF